MYFSTTIAATAVIAIAKGAALINRANSGEATFYGGNTEGGTCSFKGYTIPSDLYGLALTDSSWDNSRACGGCIEVTGPKGNKITAMVVDQCPGCGPGHLDLFPDAFAKLDDPEKGIIDVTWDFVDCPIASPIQVRNKEGVSAYWFSMQVINANKRVESLEFSTDGGASWTSTERQYYNYFQKSSGSGTTTVDVKITSIDGDVVIVKDVNISSGESATASGNFGSSGIKQPTTANVVPTGASSLVTASSTVSQAAAVLTSATTPGAIFQQEASTTIVKSTTFATSTSRQAPAPVSSQPSTRPAPIPEPVKVPEPVVTVIADACGA